MNWFCQSLTTFTLAPRNCNSKLLTTVLWEWFLMLSWRFCGLLVGNILECTVDGFVLYLNQLTDHKLKPVRYDDSELTVNFYPADKEYNVYPVWLRLYWIRIIIYTPGQRCYSREWADHGDCGPTWGHCGRVPHAGLSIHEIELFCAHPKVVLRSWPILTRPLQFRVI